jgi:hypothetical protein
MSRPANLLPRCCHLQTGPLVSPLFPQIDPPLLTHVATPAKMTAIGRPPVTTPCRKDAHVCACRLEPSRRLRCVVASHRRWPLLCCHPSPRARRRSLAPPSPLAELTWPKECRLDPGIALPACTRSQGALACPCVPRGCIDSPPAHLLTNGVWTNTLRIASTQGRYHCGVDAAPCCAREHTRSAAAPSRHLPPSPSAQAALPPHNARL